MSLVKFEKNKKPLTEISGFSNWWAHQDLNLGPKDYEQVYEIKLLQINRLKAIYRDVEANVEATLIH